MSGAADSLVEDGLAVLRDLLPRGFSVAKSSLRKDSRASETWIVVRGQARNAATCLLVARRRAEARDLGAIAAIAARTLSPTLLVSAYLSPMARQRLRGFGIGYWDLTGNARLNLSGIALLLECDGATSTGARNNSSARSLCGEMAGRVARVLVDLRSPQTLSSLASQAQVETSCASRVVAFLDEAGLVRHRPRGKIEEVRWQEILRRWSLDSPRETRGEALLFRCARGVPDFLSRLGRSGFLHALTAEAAFARLAERPMPDKVMLYVDDLEAALAQFNLHPAHDHANVILVKPADRSVFCRSRESHGLRCVSPSLMAADFADGDSLESALTWMAEHEKSWRGSG